MAMRQSGGRGRRPKPPDREINRLSILGTEPSARAKAHTMNRMNVRATIEEKLDNVSGSSHNAPMKRSAASTIAEIDERRICFEQFPYTLNVSRGRSPVNLVILARRG